MKTGWMSVKFGWKIVHRRKDGKLISALRRENPPVIYVKGFTTFPNNEDKPLFVFTDKKAAKEFMDVHMRTNPKLNLEMHSCEYEPLPPDNRWWKQPITPESILPGYIEPPYSTALAYWVRLWKGA